MTSTTQQHEQLQDLYGTGQQFTLGRILLACELVKDLRLHPDAAHRDEYRAIAHREFGVADTGLTRLFRAALESVDFDEEES